MEMGKHGCESFYNKQWFVVIYVMSVSSSTYFWQSCSRAGFIVYVTIHHGEEEGETPEVSLVLFPIPKLP